MEGTPQLSVKITPACERILKTVPQPQLKEKESMLTTIAQTRGALGVANSRIVKGRSCFARVREGFASAGANDDKR